MQNPNYTTNTLKEDCMHLEYQNIREHNFIEDQFLKKNGR